MKPIRVALVTSWSTGVIGGSGTAVFFHSLLEGLRQRNYEVDVIAPNFDIPDYVDITLQRFLFNAELRTDPRIMHADVVIGFDYDGYGLDPATRPPMLISAHAVYGDVIQWEVEPFRTMVYAQAFFDRVAMERCDYITIGSEYAKQRVVTLYGISPEKITVIPHGMVLPLWLPLVDSQPYSKNNHPVILAVGKMYPRKRLNILLNALVLLRKKYPMVEVRIVGDGLEWDRLHILASELGISGNITWLGHITNDTAFAHEWRQADIFCHPSSQETFGFVYLEAMTLGKAIVAANAGAAPEVIGEAGLLVTPNDPIALADGLDKLLQNSPLRYKYGEQARIRAKMFTHEKMIDGYEMLIQQLVDPKR